MYIFELQIYFRVKKPAGSAEEIERHFGCDCSKLIMVGDRPFTDIVYGNRNGFLTILTAPLSLAEEPFTVKQVWFPIYVFSIFFLDINTLLLYKDLGYESLN
ncbi:putative HAD superfamily, PGP phosphatase, mitochondrial/chloroplastic [Helianthus annuus]|nr:putative HAD superfamily, PGP phosphatase, mitochondrial/chloroplastic [Helianthus annuus]